MEHRNPHQGAHVSGLPSYYENRHSRKSVRFASRIEVVSTNNAPPRKETRHTQSTRKQRSDEQAVIQFTLQIAEGPSLHDSSERKSSTTTKPNTTSFLPMARPPQVNSPFFRLPAELRNRVYELVAEATQDLVAFGPRLARDSFSSITHCNSVFALAGSCAQIRAEYRPYALRRQNIVVARPLLRRYLATFYPDPDNRAHPPNHFRLVLYDWHEGFFSSVNILPLVEFQHCEDTWLPRISFGQKDSQKHSIILNALICHKNIHWINDLKCKKFAAIVVCTYGGHPTVKLLFKKNHAPPGHYLVSDVDDENDDDCNQAHSQCEQVFDGGSGQSPYLSYIDWNFKLEFPRILVGIHQQAENIHITS